MTPFCTEVVLALKFLAIGISVFAAVITVSKTLYLKLAFVFDRHGWKASKAMEELQGSAQKVPKGDRCFWLIKLTGFDTSFEKMPFKDYMDKKNNNIQGLAITGLPFNQNVELTHLVVMTASPYSDRRLFKQMYDNMIQDRQNKMSVVVLIFSIVIQMALLFVNP
jgi:hypothetical protein